MPDRHAQTETSARPSNYRRYAGKDYGWQFGIPGVLVVEIWCAGPCADAIPWSDGP